MYNQDDAVKTAIDLVLLDIPAGTPGTIVRLIACTTSGLLLAVVFEDRPVPVVLRPTLVVPICECCHAEVALPGTLCPACDEFYRAADPDTTISYPDLTEPHTASMPSLAPPQVNRAWQVVPQLVEVPVDSETPDQVSN